MALVSCVGGPLKQWRQAPPLDLPDSPLGSFKVVELLFDSEVSLKVEHSVPPFTTNEAASGIGVMRSRSPSCMHDENLLEHVIKHLLGAGKNSMTSPRFGRGRSFFHQWMNLNLAMVGNWEIEVQEEIGSEKWWRTDEDAAGMERYARAVLMWNEKKWAGFSYKKSHVALYNCARAQL
jgi:hypothetical protein